MKHVIFATGLSLFSLCVSAGQEIDKTLEAAADGYVEIEHLGGKAEIIGWDKNQVKVTGELSDKTERFIFERDGNEVAIIVRVESRKSSWSNWKDEYNDDLVIHVPRNSRINYASTNANVSVESIKGGADIETVNGRINAKDLMGRIRLGTVNGDIDSTRLNGDIKLETVNGDITDRENLSREVTYDSVNGDIDVSADSAEVRIESVNGDIDLKLSEVDLLNIETVNGRGNVYLSLARQGDVRATSVGGSLNFYFQSDVSARFDIQSHAGGRIINKLSGDKEQKAKYGPRRWLEFALGGGHGRVDVSTVSGRIRLDKQ